MQSAFAKLASAFPASALRKWQEGRRTTRPYQVMQTAVVPTFTGALTIASPKQWKAGFRNTSVPLPGSVGAGAVRFHGAGNFRVAGTSSPDDALVKPTYLTRNTTPLTSDIWRMSFNHYGRFFEFGTKNINPLALMAKINDEFISLTPQAHVPSGGPSVNGVGYWYFDLGSRDDRRIDIWGANALIGDIYTQASDSITPAATRGPRVICMGDSYTGGTGAAHMLGGWVQAFSEFTGWDDVWQSGSGSTGYIATLGGTEPPFRGRLASDVVPFAPDVLIIFGSQNDDGSSYAALNNEARLLYQQVRQSLPNTQLIVIGPQGRKGPGFHGARVNNLSAIRDACAAEGVPFIDIYELPLSVTPFVTTLRDAVSGSVNMVSQLPLQPGSVYKFADGQKFECRSSSGIPANVVADGPMTQAAGATLTQCGVSFLTGNGRVGAPGSVSGSCDELVFDVGDHPSAAGHKLIGRIIAQEVVKVLQPLFA
jgi:lysophospholipase L1-like esterase